jgi:uncharacterized protein (DUF488 family)
VQTLVDVRTVPGSRRNPQYGREALASSLGEQGIEYRHEPALGGFRKPSPDSPNGGWDNAAFRGYADYMATPEFAGALDRLQAVARERRAGGPGASTAIMCAEAQWWRCHRRLISDALVVRGWRVLHLGLRGEPIEHQLTPFAVLGEHLSLTYPPAQSNLDV